MYEGATIDKKKKHKARKARLELKRAIKKYNLEMEDIANT